MKKTYMIWLALLDWSSNISNGALIKLIQSLAPNYMESLDTGVLSYQGEKVKRGYINLQTIETQSWDSIELYGGVKNKNDPAKNWRSYFLLRESPIRELMICSSSDDISINSIIHFLENAALLGNLGYGYASTSDLGADTIYYMMGLTMGYPSNDEERHIAARLSRWFKEKSSALSGNTSKKYLKGMQRGAFELNILNADHVSKLEDNHIITDENNNKRFGTLLELENGTFIWKLSSYEKIFAENEMFSRDLII